MEHPHLRIVYALYAYEGDKRYRGTKSIVPSPVSMRQNSVTFVPKGRRL